MKTIGAIVLFLCLVFLTCTPAPAKSTVVQPVQSPPAQGPVINYFYSTPANVSCPAKATLGWSVTGADNVSIDQGIGLVKSSDNLTVTLTASTTYTLTAMKGNFKAVDTTTVLNCTAPPVGSLPTIAYFDTTPNAIPPGEIITMVWQVKGADKVTIDNGIGPVAAQGRLPIMPSGTTVYTLTATNASGFVTGQVTAQVQEPGLTSYYLPSYTTPHVGVQAIIGQQFTILEDASPSTGLTWIVEYYDPRMVSTVSNSYSVYNPPARGSEGQQQFVFTALKVGDTRILMANVDKTVPTNTHNIYYDVHIQPK
jgi:hypothetical protein